MREGVLPDRSAHAATEAGGATRGARLWPIRFSSQRRWRGLHAAARRPRAAPSLTGRGSAGAGSEFETVLRHHQFPYSPALGDEGARSSWIAHTTCAAPLMPPTACGKTLGEDWCSLGGGAVRVRRRRVSKAERIERCGPDWRGAGSRLEHANESSARPSRSRRAFGHDRRADPPCHRVSWKALSRCGEC